MALEIKARERLAAAVRRMAVEQIDAALAHLSGEKAEPWAEAIHEARTSLKKLRTILRLIRDEIGIAAYRAENATIRDLGRSLSAARDAESAVLALGELERHVPTGTSVETFAKVREHLIERRRRERRRFALDRGAAARAAEELQAARSRIKRWSMRRRSWSAVGRGVSRVYRQNCRAFTAAVADPSGESFHEWRKQAKHLWHLLRIFRPLSPKAMRSWVEAAGDLTDRLGEEHDLVVLLQVLSRERPTEFDEAELAEFERLIRNRQAELREEAKPLAERLYAEKPRAFAARLGGYWEARREKKPAKEIAR